jgi:hypothetical protein
MAGKRGKLTIRRLGREAAHDDLMGQEHCWDLAGKFARESGTKTGNANEAIRDRYETITGEFRAARYSEANEKLYSLSTALRSKYESDAALKEFLPNFAKWIGDYVSDCFHEHTFRFTPLYRQIVPRHTWKLCGHKVTRELLTALAEEYVRDRKGLLQFLSAIFKRWQKDDQPDSLLRMKVVIEQCADDVPHHRIAQLLDRTGAVAKGSAVPGTSAYRKLRWNIKKIRSRDRKSAAEKKTKALAREAARRATELKSWLECPSCRSKWVDGISICPHCKVAVKRKSR